MIPSFEAGNTVMFTWTGSTAPDSAPIFKVSETQSDTVIASLTGQQSASTQYYALYTIPTSPAVGMYVGEWYALKTLVSSAYAFVKRFQFRSHTTQALD